MKSIILKEEVDELIKIKGKTKGLSLRDHCTYILNEKGEEGLRKLEEEMEKCGYPIKYKKIKTMGFYPLGLEGLVLLIIKRLFNFSDEKIKEMAVRQAKISILIRLFTKSFLSIKKAAVLVPKMWKTIYTVGRAEVAEINEKEKYAVLIIKDFSITPIYCLYLIGYFSTLLQLIVGKKVTCEETKCIYRGDEYHEFLLKW